MEAYMNKFYKEICKYYEDIFPTNEAQLNFLNNISNNIISLVVKMQSYNHIVYGLHFFYIKKVDIF